MKYFVGLLSLFAFLSILLFRDIPALYFFSDDFVWLLNAKQDSLAQLPLYFVDSEGFFYRPVTKIYFWVMWQLVQDQAYWYHVVSLVMHSVISVFVYLLSGVLLTRILSQKALKQRIPLIAFVSAVLFFIHPIHLESIIWPSVITELIPAFCTIVGLYLFVQGYITRRKVLYGLTTVLFIVGLGGHEYMVVFPGLVYLTHIFLLQTEKNRALDFWKPLQSEKFLYLLLIFFEIAYFVLRAVSNAHWSGGDYSYDLVKLPFNIVGNLLGYFGLLVVGIPFIDWYFQLRFLLRENLLMAFAGLLVVGVLLAVIAKNVYKYRRTQSFKLFAYLLLFSLVTLLPFLGLGAIAERYIYLPSVAMILIGVYACYLLSDTIQQYTNSVSTITAFLLLTGICGSYYVFSMGRDIQQWQIASNYVSDRLIEFQTECDQFSQGELVVRSSPPNRLGRAWVYQVGYEEGANLYCDKNLRIMRK